MSFSLKTAEYPTAVLFSWRKKQLDISERGRGTISMEIITMEDFDEEDSCCAACSGNAVRVCGL